MGFFIAKNGEIKVKKDINENHVEIVPQYDFYKKIVLGHHTRSDFACPDTGGLIANLILSFIVSEGLSRGRE